jgi:hypothetical protein
MKILFDRGTASQSDKLLNNLLLAPTTSLPSHRSTILPGCLPYCCVTSTEFFLLYHDPLAPPDSFVGGQNCPHMFTGRRISNVPVLRCCHDACRWRSQAGAHKRGYMYIQNPHMGSSFPCACAPHPPDPLLPQKEQGEVGRPEAQNEIGNAGASQEPAPVRRGRPALAGRQGRDARAPNADETPAIPGGAGCPRSQAGRMPALPGGAGCPRPWHAGETPALPGGAGCPRSQAGRMPALPGEARCSRSRHAGETPALPGGAGTRTVPARQEHGL